MRASAAELAGADARPQSATDRLAQAWREMRRGAMTGVLVEHLFGRPGEAEYLDPSHLDVLDLLVARDGQRMSELASALRVDPSTVTRAMIRMEAADLATRHPSEHDGRVVTVHLTDTGRRLHALVAARRAALIDAGMAALEPSEREQLVDLLERFLAAMASTARSTPDQGR